MNRRLFYPRYAAALFFFSLSLVVVSFVQGSSLVSGELIESGSIHGQVVVSSGRIHIDAWGRDGRALSIYVVDLDGVILAIREGSIANVTAIYSVENVIEYSSTVEVPGLGWYGVLVTQANDTHPNMRYDMIVSRGVPNPLVLVPGLAILVVSLALMVRSMESKKQG